MVVCCNAAVGRKVTPVHVELQSRWKDRHLPIFMRHQIHSRTELRILYPRAQSFPLIEQGENEENREIHCARIFVEGRASISSKLPGTISLAHRVSHFAYGLQRPLVK